MAGTVVFLLVALLILTIVVTTLVVRRRRQRRSQDCRSCSHWDQEAGQANLRRSAVFSAVMRELTPNDELGKPVVTTEKRMTLEGVEEEVRVVRRLPIWSTFENRWEYLGACMVNQELTHRTYVCPKYSRKG